MAITSKEIKALRDETGISVMQCKKALEEAGGDMEKAKILLRKKSSETAAKKSDRSLGAAAIAAYVHNTNEVAAMVQLSCETDFVSQNQEFVALARDIAMHVAALAPSYITRDEVDAETVEKASAVFKEEIADKPADVQEKILAGKLDSYFKEQVLMEQPFIKDQDRTIEELITTAVQKFGENIVIADMHRMSVK